MKGFVVALSVTVVCVGLRVSGGRVDAVSESSALYDFDLASTN